MKNAQERFNKKYKKQKDGCWVWIASIRPDGYGQFSFDGKPRLAHKWNYEQLNGAVPDGLELDHICRKRCCVNPEHLEPVTRSENTIRGNLHNVLRDKWSKITHCPHGHEYTKDNTYITKIGTRSCIACKRESTRRHRNRK